MNLLRRCLCTTSITKVPQWRDTVIFKPDITSGYVIKVYDGDTITIASKLNRQTPIYRWRIRILGIDCPEIKTKNDTEKKVAIIARDTLSKMILHKKVNLKNISYDKYGRILCDVYYKKILISKWLLDKKLAVTYDGGTKKTPNCWLEYYTN
tara:strand:+ start:4257 stop:4712 length:456 start_codon:yes stop_codon:yes gene_type:complete